MKSVRISDPRLHRRPAIYRSGDTVRIKARVLPPLRLAALLQCVYLPLRNVAKLIGVVFAVWLAGWHFDLLPSPDDLPFPWEWVLAVAVLGLILWKVEKAWGFAFSRMAFGRILYIVITPERMTVGRWLPTNGWPRAGRFAIVHGPIPGARTEFYRDAQVIECVLGDSTRHRIVESFGLVATRRIVENVNLAATFVDEKYGREIDPIAQRLARERRVLR